MLGVAIITGFHAHLNLPIAASSRRAVGETLVAVDGVAVITTLPRLNHAVAAMAYAWPKGLSTPPPRERLFFAGATAHGVGFRLLAPLEMRRTVYRGQQLGSDTDDVAPTRL